MAREIFGRIKADEYVKGEADFIDVVNATDLDKFIGNHDANAMDAITEAATRKAVRDGAKTAVAGVAYAFALCIMADGFYKLLYVIGAFIFPFLMPYVFYNFLLGDRERMYAGLLGGILMLLCSLRNKFGLALVGISLFVCAVIVVCWEFQIGWFFELVQEFFPVKY